MRTLAYITLAVFPVVALLGQDISTPQKRMASLDLARRLLTTESAIEAADTLESKTPFRLKIAAPEVAASVAVEVPEVVVTVADRDRLLLLAPRVIPTGSVQLGNTGMLLFGQKRLKVGDVIPIVFQSITYDLQITAIDRTTFTLRLNNEEIIRPIKPVSK
jgi:hypothetical protein